MVDVVSCVRSPLSGMLRVRIMSATDVKAKAGLYTVAGVYRCVQPVLYACTVCAFMHNAEH